MKIRCASLLSGTLLMLGGCEDGSRPNAHTKPQEGTPKVEKSVEIERSGAPEAGGFDDPRSTFGVALEGAGAVAAFAPSSATERTAGIAVFRPTEGGMTATISLKHLDPGSYVLQLERDDECSSDAARKPLIAKGDVTPALGQGDLILGRIKVDGSGIGKLETKINERIAKDPRALSAYSISVRQIPQQRHAVQTIPGIVACAEIDLREHAG